VESVACSPRGDLVATGASDRTARLWDVATGACTATLTGHSVGVAGLAFSPDGKRLVTAGNDGTARVWDARTGKLRLSLEGHDTSLHGAAFSPSGALIATASHDVRLWDARTGTHLATLVPLPAGGYATLLPDGGFKLDGDPGDFLWWAVGLRRLTAGEADALPGARRLPLDAPILAASPR
jgi:WD40 repeat protein